MSMKKQRRCLNKMLRAKEILEKDKEYVMRAWKSIAEPVAIVEGKGAIVKDADDKEYLDFASGYFVNVCGHSHENIIKAVSDQVKKVSQVSMKQTTVPLVLLAEKLAKITPGSLKKSFFATGGSEAIEFAMKMARCHTKKHEIIALKNAYHGLSLAALSASTNTRYRATAYNPLPSGVSHVPNAYCYRCKYCNDGCDLQCAREIENVIKGKSFEVVSTENIGSLMIELVQSVGGITPPDEWFKVVKEICERNNILLIVDEIQTGLGRTGKMFACEHWDIKPDIMVLAKGISGGIGSMGVTIAGEEVVENFSSGTCSTLAGNAVSCAGGLALIETLEKEKIPENAAKIGKYLKKQLSDLNNKYFGDIRFKGLMGGVEMVEDKETKEPLKKEKMLKIAQKLKDKGVIITISGPLGNVFRMQPVLTITEEQIDKFVNIFEETVKEVCG